MAPVRHATRKRALVRGIAGLGLAVVVSASDCFGDAVQCPAACYITKGKRSLVTRKGPGPDSVLIGDTSITVPGRCAAAPLRRRSTKHGLSIDTRWTSCSGAKGNVRLRGTIAKDCATLKGSVRAGSRPPRSFTATRSSCADSTTGRPAAPTIGTVVPGEIGGDGLTVYSAYQAPAPVQSGVFSSTVSSLGPEVLLLVDANGTLRGMTMSRPGAGGASPTILPAGAESTALGVMFLTPGILTIDPAEADRLLTTLRSLSAFADLVSMLRAMLPTTSLNDVVQTDDFGRLRKACVAEWEATSPATAASVSVVGAQSGFSVQADETHLPDVSLTVQNAGYRYVNVTRRPLDSANYEITDGIVRGVGAGLVCPMPGALPVSWGSIFTSSSTAVVPSTVSDSWTFSSDVPTVEYWAAGWGFIPGPAVPDSVLGDTPVALGCSLIFYGVLPIADALTGGMGFLDDPGKAARVVEAAWDYVSSDLDLTDAMQALQLQDGIGLETALADLTTIVLGHLPDVLEAAGIASSGWVAILNPLMAVIGVVPGTINTVRAVQYWSTAVDVVEVTASSHTTSTLPACGNGRCDAGETCVTCPIDCPCSFGRRLTTDAGGGCNDSVGLIGSPLGGTISADGSVAVFQSCRNLTGSNPGGNLHAFSVRTDGSSLVDLPLSPGSGSILSAPTLSGNGHVVAYAQSDPLGYRQIVVTDADGSYLSTPPLGDDITEPDVSRDGSILSFASPLDSSHPVWVADPTGLVFLRPIAAENIGSLSGDGHWQFFGGFNDSCVTVSRVTTDGSDVREDLVCATELLGDPRANFDGTRAVFVSTDDLVSGQNPTVNVQQAFLWRNDGPLEQLSNNVMPEFDLAPAVSVPTISGDGRRAAFTVGWDLFVVDLTTGQKQQLISSDQQGLCAHDPSLDFDGRKLLVGIGQPYAAGCGIFLADDELYVADLP